MLDEQHGRAHAPNRLILSPDAIKARQSVTAAPPVGRGRALPGATSGLDPRPDKSWGSRVTDSRPHERQGFVSLMQSRKSSAPIPAAARWSSLETELSDRLLRLAVLIVGRDDAHDVVADALERVASTVEWNSVESHKAYLTRAVYHAACSHARRSSRRRRREVDAMRQGAFASNTPLEGAVVAQLLVRTAIRRLPPRQRAVLFLHYWEDLPLSPDQS